MDQALLIPPDALSNIPEVTLLPLVPLSILEAPNVFNLLINLLKPKQGNSTDLERVDISTIQDTLKLKKYIIGNFLRFTYFMAKEGKQNTEQIAQLEIAIGIIFNGHIILPHNGVNINLLSANSTTLISALRNKLPDYKETILDLYVFLKLTYKIFMETIIDNEDIYSNSIITPLILDLLNEVEVINQSVVA